jgi:hypothetical protein
MSDEALGRQALPFEGIERWSVSSLVRERTSAVVRRTVE